MTLPTDVVQDDPFASADAAKPRDYEYFGQVHIDAWFAYFAGGGAKPIPFDPQQHPVDKRTTVIEMQIIPINEQNITKDVKQFFTDFSPDWTRITLPSIKALGVGGTHDLHGKFVRVAMVDGKRKIVKDGVETGDFWKTWKFAEVFASEADCVKAYAGNGHVAPTEPQPEPAPINGNGHNPDLDTALKFAQVVISGICKGKTANDFDAVKQEVALKLAGMPMINKHLTVDSPEIQTMIMTELAK